MDKVKQIAFIAFILAAYYFIYYFYLGIINPIPLPGDSFDYHIPIQQSILNGSFLTGVGLNKYPWFYPGSAEAINSIFIFLHIPLTLSNLFASLVLFFVCLKLGLVFLKNKYYALLFTSTVISLTVIVRWFNAISIDIWTAVFFLLSIIMLEKPQKSLKYFASLGFVSGMLIGSKYTAILFLIPILLIYRKNIISKLNLSRFISFLIPFSVFGLFWYIRNFLITKNPFYPIPILGFKGHVLFTGNVLGESIRNPLEMINAFFGEYKLWIITPIIAVVFLIYKIYKKKFALDNLTKIFSIGIINFLLYFTFPTSYQPWIMVSSLRYSFPVFIPLMLGVFLLFQKYKKEELIGYFSIANSFSILSMVFYPKLILVFLPISALFLYLFEKRVKQ